MKLIKLNAIGSTNSYLKALLPNLTSKDPIVVVAENQTKGRGQQGAVWNSEASKSLTFSVLKYFDAVPAAKQAVLNFAVSLGMLDGLKVLGVPKIIIKWPNDILSQQQKIAGILIENQLQRQNIASSIIGIGLNVNEEFFKDLPQATSMKLATGMHFNLEEVLKTITASIFKRLNEIEQTDFHFLKEQYENHLFKKDEISVFETPDKTRRNGKILGVTDSGQLIVSHEDDEIAQYAIKEVKMLY